MHDTAMRSGKLFFDTYVRGMRDGVIVVDIGAQDVNGSLRSVCPNNANYIGVDFADEKGVDVVLDDPYKLPFDDDSIDVVVSSSCFEHSEMFWLTFLEICRVMKPSGIFYLNAPSNFFFHRYPVDCYRFYPDSANALAKWARRNKYNTCVLEHYTSGADYVAVFLNDERYVTDFQNRSIYYVPDFSCGAIYPEMETFVFPGNLGEKKLTHYASHLGDVELFIKK
jgi:SAM-dependent methyltransferase